VSGFKITSKIVKDVNSQTFAKLKLRAAVDKKFTKVGIPGTVKEPEEGTPLALIGLVMEFGSPDKGIPERPSLIPATRKGKPDFIRLNKRNLVKILREQTTLDKSLGQLGAMAVGKVKQEILHGDFVPLKAATIAARQRRLSEGYKRSLARRQGKPLALDKPLVDTGNFLAGFTYQLVAKGKK
jgi:hypothetical protein